MGERKLLPSVFLLAVAIGTVKALAMYLGVFLSMMGLSTIKYIYIGGFPFFFLIK
jgi:hypothetical protein